LFHILFPKRRTKGRCRAAHLCLFNPRQGDVLCVELRVTQRFLSIIHRAAAASVLLFNSPADHIIPSPQPKAICETRALQGNSIKAPNISNEALQPFCFKSYILAERWMHLFVYKAITFLWRCVSSMHFQRINDTQWNVLIKMPVFRYVQLSSRSSSKA